MPEANKREARLLGFDYGSKRIGAAVGTTTTATATALTSIAYKNPPMLWTAMGNLIEQWCPDAVVVGWPSHANGQPHQLWPAIEQFTSQLQAQWALSVHRVDEYLTSFEAEQWAGPQPQKRRRVDSQDIDAIAAKLILESWLRLNQYDPQ